MAQVTELITAFTFVGNISPLNNFNSSMGRSIKVMAGFITAGAAMSGTILKLADSQLKGLQSLINISKVTDISTQSLSELQFAAEATNSSSAALTSTLDSLSQTIGDASFSGLPDALNQIGVGVKDGNGELKTADKLLFDIGKRFNELGLNIQQKRSLADSLGIDTTLLTLMSKTAAEVNRLRKEAQDYGVLTDNQIVQVELYNAANNKLSAGFKTLRNLLAISLVPELISMADSFRELLADNKDLIEKGLKLTVEVVGDMGKAIVRLLPLLKVFAGIWIAMNIPTILIALAMAAFLLVVDDLFSLMNGNKSVIGDFFEDFLGVDLKGVIGDLNDLLGVFKPLLEIIRAFGKIPEIKGNIKIIQDDQSEFTGGDFATALLDDIFQNLSKKTGFDIDPFDREAARTRPSGGSNSIKQEITINVNGKSPTATASAIDNVLKKQLDNANTMNASQGGI